MYYILYGILYAVSLLPFWLMYGFSDLCAFILSRLIKYRRAVIFENLDIAFPQKTIAEKEAIASGFYRHFTDTFIESIKMLSMSEATFRKRVYFEMDAFKDLLQGSKKIQVDSIHQMNWEYGSLAASLYLPVPFIAVYRRLSNDAADWLFLKIRSRFGAMLTDTDQLARRMKEFENQPYALGMIADQNPGYSNKAFWAYLFGKPTAFLPGIEFTAIRHKMAVVFTNMIPQQKRGYYRIENRLITTDASQYKRGELILTYRNFLEESMLLHPETYLWSHRRFKHSFKGRDAKNWIEGEAPPVNESTA